MLISGWYQPTKVATKTWDLLLSETIYTEIDFSREDFSSEFGRERLEVSANFRTNGLSSHAASNSV